MPDRRIIGDLDMLHRGPTCSIIDRHACGDILETDMPEESNRNFNTFI